MLDGLALEVDPQVVAAVALAAAGLAVVLLLVVVLQGLRLRRLRHAFERALPDGQDVLTTLGSQGQRLDALGDDVAGALAETREVAERLRASISKVGVVRYDAFDDMGGALSFSAALLDQSGDGVVVSAINGRTETRCYAKSISGGTSDHSLSTEETAAVEAAMTGRRTDVAPARVPRRRRRVS
jgi:hypothetical protein